MDPEFSLIYEKCRHFTKTNRERMYAMYKATEYVVRKGIPGAIVECGVWRGGSVMVSALTLNRLEEKERQIFLYDTYTGMVEPGERDVTVKRGHSARPRWEMRQKDGYNTWCLATLEEVKQNMALTKYPENKFVYVKGRVEDTIPKVVPDRISILRLDTDFYDSTKHELEHLFPRLSVGGVIMIDDYGCFQGAKDAVDEYFTGHKFILLHRVDSSGRVGIKI